MKHFEVLRKTDQSFSLFLLIRKKMYSHDVLFVKLYNLEGNPR